MEGVLGVKEGPTCHKITGEGENPFEKIKHGKEKRFTERFPDTIMDSGYIQEKDGTIKIYPLMI